MKEVSLVVKSSVFNFSGNFPSRITLVRGDSGVGKTALVNLLAESLPDVIVKCKLRVIVPSPNCWESIVRGGENAIIFFDDADFTETLEFVSLCKECLEKNNLFIVVLGRATLAEDLTEEVKELNFKSNGIDHWLES